MVDLPVTRSKRGGKGYRYTIISIVRTVLFVVCSLLFYGKGVDMSKTHFRKVYKSDHLGVADLEDFIEEKRSLVFRIKEVKQQYDITVAGKKGNFNVAYFHENIKPLVLNATNANQVKIFSGGSSWVEDWKDIPVELIIDHSVKMKGQVVGGVRISPVRPVIEDEKKPFTSERFEGAKKAEATIEMIEEIYSIDEKTKEAYLKYLEDGGTED